MSELRERAAQASGRYTDEEWAELAESNDPLDKLTVTNARAVADNILALPEIVNGIQPKGHLCPNCGAALTSAALSREPSRSVRVSDLTEEEVQAIRDAKPPASSS
jgi:hypothetical protein